MVSALLACAKSFDIRDTAPNQVNSDVAFRIGRSLGHQFLKQVEKSGIGALDLNVTVDGGTFLLWGGMRSVVEQQVFRVAAKAAEGRRRVEDHVFVGPPLVSANLGAQ